MNENACNNFIKVFPKKITETLENQLILSPHFYQKGKYTIYVQTIHYGKNE